jgi:membrane protease YdiL (CAAX protease family)
MAEQIEQAPRTDLSRVRSWMIRHPIATFLMLVYATTAALVFVPRVLTEPGMLPGGATPHGVLENVLGSAVPAFIVTALVSGKVGVRDLARRSFRWRVPLRWYLISLLAPLLILLIAITILYGLAPLRALAQNWLLLFTSFLPALVVMVVLNNVAEEIGWTGFVFARLQDRRGPLRAALATTVFFWLYHVPGFYVDTRSWAATAVVLGFLLLPHLASRFIVGWLYNGAGASVLIAGLFHSMHNAMVNPTGFGVAVLGLPQGDILVIVAGLVVLAGGIIAVATRGRLGLKRLSEPDADRVSEG